MAQWAHGGGFSVDVSVRIEAAHRAGRERLLRYCARPSFALERLCQLDPECLVYDHPQPAPAAVVRRSSPRSSCSTASLLWCRPRVSTAIATSGC